MLSLPASPRLQPSRSLFSSLPKNISAVPPSRYYGIPFISSLHHNQAAPKSLKTKDIAALSESGGHGKSSTPILSSPKRAALPRNGQRRVNMIHPGNWTVDPTYMDGSTPDAQREHINILHPESKHPLGVNKSRLRDACTCERCVDPSSGQKRFTTCDIPSDLPIAHAKRCGNGVLEISWTNDFLTHNSHITRLVGENLEAILAVNNSDFTNAVVSEARSKTRKHKGSRERKTKSGHNERSKGVETDSGYWAYLLGHEGEHYDDFENSTGFSDFDFQSQV
ncbi:putative TauD/TfdA-like domain-containing protein [Seiridium cardinale]|uniref:TauD/TfdA-like domain-containing protein n=1 Tax=Seiridium cardinale TaxID=138064 RepID=A0ABR2XZC0_9PEZI